MEHTEMYAELCKQILGMDAEFHPNTNGDEENICPFCLQKKYTNRYGTKTVEMNDINHEENCAYLIAKILTGK